MGNCYFVLCHGVVGSRCMRCDLVLFWMEKVEKLQQSVMCHGHHHIQGRGSRQISTDIVINFECVKDIILGSTEFLFLQFVCVIYT